MAKEQTEVKKVSRIKSKKKSWLKIMAPRVFGQKEIGESYVASADSTIGRKLKINLKDLTGNVKDQNVYIGFQIIKVSGSVLTTALVSYELTSSAVKRMVRKMTSRLDDAFTFQTKGGKTVVIKTLMITLHQAQRSQESQLRHELKNMLAEEITKNGFDNFVNALVNGRLHNLARKRLNKIFPVKELGIKLLKLKQTGLAQEEWLAEHSEEPAAPAPAVSPEQVAA